MPSSHFQNFALHEVLFRQVLEGKTGFIAVSPGGRRLYFESGQLVYALSDERDEQFTHFLVERGKVTEDQLETLKNQLRKGESLASVLKQRGLVTTQDLAHALKLQIIRITDRIFALGKCQADLVEKMLPPKMPRLKIQTLNLFAKAVARLQPRYLPSSDVSEWSASQTFPGSDFAEMPEILKPWALFLESQERWSLDDAALGLGFGEDLLRLGTYLLRQMNWIEAAPMPEALVNLDTTFSEQVALPIVPAVDHTDSFAEASDSYMEEIEPLPGANLLPAQQVPVPIQRVTEEEILELDDEYEEATTEPVPKLAVEEQRETSLDDTNPAFEPQEEPETLPSPAFIPLASPDEFEIDDDAGPEDFNSVTKDLDEQADELDFALTSPNEDPHEGHEAHAKAPSVSAEAAFDALDDALAEMRQSGLQEAATPSDPFGFASDDEPEAEIESDTGLEHEHEATYFDEHVDQPIPEGAPSPKESETFTIPKAPALPLLAALEPPEAHRSEQPAGFAPYEADEEAQKPSTSTSQKRKRPLIFVAILALFAILTFFLMRPKADRVLENQLATPSMQQPESEVLPETHIREDQPSAIQQLPEHLDQQTITEGNVETQTELSLASTAEQTEPNTATPHSDQGSSGSNTNLPESIDAKLQELTAMSQSHFRDEKGRYSIAFMTACQAQTLRVQLHRFDELQLFVLPRNLNGSDCFVFTWGQFLSKEEALSAIAALPEGLVEKGDRAMVVDALQYFH